MKNADNAAVAAYLKAARLFAAGLFCWLLTCSSVLCAQDAPAPSSAPATATLQFQDASFTVASWNVPILHTTAAFKKEPDLGRNKVFRGTLQFGSNPTNAVAFLWDRTAKKLYLDLNHNLDLTDDPTGVLPCASTATYFETFNDLRFPLQTRLGPLPLLIRLGFYAYGNRPSCNAEIRSFWQGQLTLAGQDCQVGLVSSDFGQLCQGDQGHLLVRPWSARTQSFSTYWNSSDTIPYGSKLFVRDHAFLVDRSSESAAATAPQLKLSFTEQHPALGELRLPGKFIHRLILQDGPYQVVLDQPKKVVRIPAGQYKQLKVWLKVGASEAHREGRQTLTITTNQTATCAAGGPLTNSVAVVARGRLLSLSYQVLGADGVPYELINQDRSKPPRFTIRKEGKVVASGKFEFG